MNKYLVAGKAGGDHGCISGRLGRYPPLFVMQATAIASQPSLLIVHVTSSAIESAKYQIDLESTVDSSDLKAIAAEFLSSIQIAIYRS